MRGYRVSQTWTISRRSSWIAGYDVLPGLTSDFVLRVAARQSAGGSRQLDEAARYISPRKSYAAAPELSSLKLPELGRIRSISLQSLLSRCLCTELRNCSADDAGSLIRRCC